MSKIKFDILIEYLINHIRLDYDKNLNVYNIVVSDVLLKPSRSNWYNHKRKFCDINFKIEKFVSLSEGEQERFELTFNEQLKDTQYYSYFSFYTIFKDNLFYTQHKEDCKELEYYGIEDCDERVRFSVGKGSVSHSTYYSKSKLLSLFKKRYNDLVKLKKVLEASKLKIPKVGKVGQYYNEFSKSIKEVVITEDSLTLFKKLVNVKYSKYSKEYPIHSFIDNAADIIGAVKKDACNWTIDNGWGSYTYTYIRNVIDLDLSDEEYLILHFAWAYYKKNNKLSSREADRYIHLSHRTLGMVQCSGGYTHVSG